MLAAPDRAVEGLDDMSQIRATNDAGCFVLDCGRPVIARGMCWTHYGRALRSLPVFVYLAQSGSRNRVVTFGPDLPPGWKPPRRVPSIAPIEERFWARVDKNGLQMPHMPSRCWGWTGQTRDGYATLRLGGRGTAIVRASRIAWRIHTGTEPPDGVLVCHRCDNPPCTRGDHLFLGDHAANSADKVAKGRQARGERSGVAKLTEAAVRDIRHRAELGEPLQLLAAEHRVSEGCVWAAVSGHTWKHVGPEALGT
jgi:hypothetical protein